MSGFWPLTSSSLLSDAQVVCVVTSKNKSFVDPVHKMPLDAPVELCQQYGNNVCYYLTPQPAAESTCRLNVFEVLMNVRK